MKKTLWILPILFISFAIPNFAEQKVRITNGDWPPYLSENLKHYGVISRIVTEAFAVHNVVVEYDFFPWGRAYVLAKEGDWDGSVVWYYKEERAKDFFFSEPVIEMKQVFFYLKSSSFNWKTYDDLKGIYVGATIGYFYSESFDKAEKAGKILVERVHTDLINFKKLLMKRIMIFPSDLDAGYYVLQRDFKKEDVELITHHPKLIAAKQSHLILSKKIKRNERLIKLFNKGLRALKENGKYDQYLIESRRGEYLKK